MITTGRVPPMGYVRAGTGAPLLLLHGIGSAHGAFGPVLPALAERFDVLAPDLPGFGTSPALPAGVEPTPARLARAVADLLVALGVEEPHVVGNSLGGWVALELAAVHPTASVTLLSPAGLWPEGTPRYCRASLRASRRLACHAPRALAAAVSHPLGRLLVLGQTHARAARLDAGYARAVVAAMRDATGFDATLAATADLHYPGNPDLDVPVTVAFGSRDLLLRGRSRRLDRLPPQARTMTLPGCGHLPMADDPALVAELIGIAARRPV